MKTPRSERRWGRSINLTDAENDAADGLALASGQGKGATVGALILAEVKRRARKAAPDIPESVFGSLNDQGGV